MFKEHYKAEIGYYIHEKHRRKGLMTEAVKAIINCGFNTLNLNRIEACLSPENIGSKKIIEKCGFTLEGKMRQHYWINEVGHDSLLYALLREDEIQF